MDNVLTQFKTGLTALFKKKPSSVIGIDIGSSSVKVVQLSLRRGAAVLDTYGEIALGPYAGLEVGQVASLSTERLVRALLDVMSEAKVTSKTGGISIPFTSSLVTMIQFPKVEGSQLEKMIPLEARKYIPVPVAEVSLDWFVVPEGEEALFNHRESNQEGEAKKRSSLSRVNVLLVAIHNDVLNTYQSIVEHAGLDISFLEIEIFSSIRAVVGSTLAPVAVLDIGAAKSKLYVVEYGVVKMSHLINRGSHDITLSISRSLGMDVKRAEEYKRTEGLAGSDPEANEAINRSLDHIFSEVNRVLLSYQKKYNRNIGSIILTGGGSVLKGLLPLAQERLETDVELGNPFRKTEAPAFLEDVLREVGPEFSVAVGLALRKLQEVSA